jgi:glycolate oxidase iron-sulfur subunit
MDDRKYISELLKCVRCGSCKAFCPIYDEDSMESMGARGRLSLLLGLSTGKLFPSKILNDRIFSCTLCGACSDLCPLGVDIKEVIYHGRNILNKSDRKRRHLRFLAKFFTKSPGLCFKLLGMTQHMFLPWLSKKGLLPFQAELPDRRFKDSVQVVTVTNRKGRVAVFTGCGIDFIYPRLGESLINVLHTLGYEVILPAGEVCCGAPLRTLGLEDEAASMAEKNLDLFGKLHVDAVLSLCPTCTLTIKKEYPKLVGKGIENAFDISEFIMDKLKASQFSDPPAHIKTAFYHDPCHLKYGLGITKEPRQIIRNTGIDLMEAEENRCCGFAGLFCFSNKKLSKGLLNKCIRGLENPDAETIITSCPGCMMQLSRERGNKPVLHLIEVIEEAMIRQS